MDLTSDQHDFLEHHKIQLESVFDAKGMSKGDYGPKMKSLGKSVAVGVTACGKSGHTMRDRHGQCVQCNPKSIKFRARYHETEFVYVAGSLSANLLKIGYTGDIKQRESSLNSYDWYGDFRDWKILIGIKCESAGTVERIVKNNLREFNLPLRYEKNGKSKISEEIFSCGFSEAWKAFCSVDPTIFEFWKSDGTPLIYDFNRPAPQKMDIEMREGYAENNDQEGILETYVPLGVFRLCCAVCGINGEPALLAKFSKGYSPKKSREVVNILETLNAEERAILIFHFGLPVNANDISSISKEMITNPLSSHKIVTNGLQKMRYPSRMGPLIQLFPMMRPE